LGLIAVIQTSSFNDPYSDRCNEVPLLNAEILRPQDVMLVVELLGNQTGTATNPKIGTYYKFLYR
jgi:hypothetical protein